jgi:hypothetical protein
LARPGGMGERIRGECAGDVQTVRRSASACTSPSIPRKSEGAKGCAADRGLPQARSGDAPELCAIPGLQRIISSAVASRTKCADSICAAHASLRPGHTSIYFVETSKAAVIISAFQPGRHERQLLRERKQMTSTMIRAGVIRTTSYITLQPATRSQLRHPSPTDRWSRTLISAANRQRHG